MNSKIIQAITERRLVEFQYQGHQRIAEPHIYGKNGDTKQLLIYQIGGGSKSGKLPNWRRIDLSEVSSFRVCEEKFKSHRQSPSGEHSSWDQIFAIVS